jgi:hypothetical protein
MIRASDDTEPPALVPYGNTENEDNTTTDETNGNESAVNPPRRLPAITSPSTSQSTNSPFGADFNLNDGNESADSSPTDNETPAANKPAELPLTPQLIELRERVRDCLGYYYNQHDSVVDHSPWGIMHVVIAYGADTQVYANNRKVNGISYLCWNGTCRGQQLFFVNRGRLETRVGPGVQGHDGQFLAIVAQSKVKRDYPMRVDGQDFTLEDLIKYEQRTCEAGTELTFKLIGLAHYLDSEATWKNQNGEDWSISRLIKEELAQPIIGAACGGTHRLTGFTYAVRKREKEGKPLNGQFMRARKYLDDYFDYTYYLQNDDGSFSTDFYRGRNAYGSINDRIETTGHMLEFLVASLTNEQLREPRCIKSVEYLTDLMLRNRSHNWEVGPKGHALHALAIYDERVFGDRPGDRANVLSRKISNTASEPARR